VETKFEQLARKYDQKLAWAQLLCDSLTAQGIEYGIQFDFDNLKVCRSLLAHKALKYAEQQGGGNAYLARLFSRQFEHGQLLSDWTILSELANNLGISLPTESELEHDTRIQQAIDDDRDIAEQIGIQAVPFYVFNQAIGMEGVQPVAHFKQQLLALKNPQ
jgi:protein disulfide-isomerase